MTKTRLVPLESITFKDSYVLSHLSKFLHTAFCKYKNFDENQTVWVYGFPKSGNDFMGFESRDYSFGFSSNNYRISSFMSNDLVIASCPVHELYSYVQKVEGSYV